MKYKERSHLHRLKVQGEAASAGGEAATHYPEGLVEIGDEGGAALNSRFSVWMQQSYIEEDTIQDFRTQRGEVNAWLQRADWLSDYGIMQLVNLG